MTEDLDQQLVEVMARAIWDAGEQRFPARARQPYSSNPMYAVQDMARAALSALRKSGYEVGPRLATHADWLRVCVFCGKSYPAAPPAPGTGEEKGSPVFDNADDALAHLRKLRKET